MGATGAEAAATVTARGSRSTLHPRASLPMLVRHGGDRGGGADDRHAERESNYRQVPGRLRRHLPAVFCRRSQLRKEVAMLIMAVHQVPSLTQESTRKSSEGSRTARAAWSPYPACLSRASWFTLPDSARTALHCRRI
jgi:hypothetical protein